MRLLTCSLMVAGTVAGCGAGDVVIARTFDPCEPIGLDAVDATAAQRTGLTDAIALWRGRGVIAVMDQAVDGAPTIPVVFQPANPTFHGYYDDEAAIIYINVDLDADPAARAITIAHELGHAFGLYHVSPEERDSLMNPHNLTIGPTVADEHEVELLWGVCQ